MLSESRNCSGLNPSGRGRLAVARRQNTLSRSLGKERATPISWKSWEQIRREEGVYPKWYVPCHRPGRLSARKTSVSWPASQLVTSRAMTRPGRAARQDQPRIIKRRRKSVFHTGLEPRPQGLRAPRRCGPSIRRPPTAERYASFFGEALEHHLGPANRQVAYEYITRAARRPLP